MHLGTLRLLGIVLALVALVSACGGEDLGGEKLPTDAAGLGAAAAAWACLFHRMSHST